jgi:hypothetical protein
MAGASGRVERGQWRFSTRGIHQKPDPTRIGRPAHAFRIAKVWPSLECHLVLMRTKLLRATNDWSMSLIFTLTKIQSE